MEEVYHVVKVMSLRQTDCFIFCSLFNNVILVLKTMENSPEKCVCSFVSQEKSETKKILNSERVTGVCVSVSV